jgi:tetratricopeptide (TPR) repeat protein
LAHRLVWLAVMLAGLAAAAEPAHLERLEAAVARHPDDRDLSWSHVRALSEAGRGAEAADRLRLHLARWPGHPPGGEALLGRWLYELGRDAEAVAVLESALAKDPGSADTRLVLGLAHRRLGRLPEAERHFEMVAVQEPALAGEALLLAGLARLERGDEAGAQALLRQVIALGPDTEAGRSARLVIEGARAGEGRRLRLETHAGVAYDSNVTLESQESPLAAGQDESDVRFDFGALARVRAWSGERTAVDVGTRYDGDRHLEIGEYDSHRFSGSVSARHVLGDRVALRVDGFGGYAWLDSDPYLVSGLVRPSLLTSVGDRAGVLRAFAEGERLAYREDPAVSAFERSGWAFGGGLEHFVPIPVGEERAWLSLGAGFRRLETDSDADALLGFSGDYDHDRWRGSVSSQLALPWSVRATAQVAFDLERYANENLTGFLTEFERDERSDRVWTTDLSLARPLSGLVDLEVTWSFCDRASNVDLFSYDRHVVGLSVRAHTP